MLQVQNLHKSYGTAVVLAGAQLIVNDGEHVGLIGPNGTGKSTLLRCILRQEQPDKGTIILTPSDQTIGYLAQSFDDLGERTVGEVVADAQAEWLAAERDLQQAAEALGSAGDPDAAMAAYDQALTHFEALGGYEREHRAAAILEGLGLGAIDPQTRAMSLSGGQKTRLGLATLLLSEPKLLLLDEPTNHLDVQALEWLESFVQRYPHAVLIVSHDREFLDRTVTRILALDPDTRTIKSYTGNYSDYAAARDHEHEVHVETYKKQQEYIERVETDIARLKGQALGVELSTTPRQPVVRRYAKKVAKKAKSRERKLERYLDSDERVEKPKNHWSLKLDFGPPPAGGRAVLRIEELSFAYPGCDPLFQHVNLDVQYGERIALVGPNGAGKTTLLRLIENKLEPENGRIRIGANVRLGSMAQEHETLDLNQTVLAMVLHERPMSETEARNFLHFFLFSGDAVFRRVGACSLGERSRLMLALLVLRGCNLLLLDEPLN
ncbi:MAG: ABC-F family ATP-binding cassette domain-containing protein, partial [Chloroflexi bacterium]|nr:ABC-F family ATP-binding cassette domain-containing protein [Chloroflexota bacterium]